MKKKKKTPRVTLNEPTLRASPSPSTGRPARQTLSLGKGAKSYDCWVESLTRIDNFSNEHNGRSITAHNHVLKRARREGFANGDILDDDDDDESNRLDGSNGRSGQPFRKTLECAEFDRHSRIYPRQPTNPDKVNYLHTTEPTSPPASTSRESMQIF
ncbi:hypothetical protein M514_08941 [Trichuris suis]|uniref:Uncharacterized protein n=1 Tax=Trichuris suis TaxID=68888 RepID=A0A085NLR2_9BILA|nr:hypothetical protein M513_08941 [Trichuris suis]KFD70408.1 hypothetical protein M514_08941 [Trichuris suis]